MNVSLLQTGDARWMSFLEQCPHDFHHLPGYLKISARYESGEPLAILVEDGDDKLLVPMLLRPLPGQLAESGFRDSSSPYGYPSPLFILSRQNAKIAQSLMLGLQEFCLEEKIITLFSRFHPLLSVPDEYFDGIGQVIAHGPTVYVDLQLSQDELISQIRKPVAKVCRQTARKGFTMRVGTQDDLSTFVHLYHSTMDRLNASSFYYFSLEYFQSLMSELGDILKLLIVSDENGKDVCATLVGCCGDICQLHLMGADTACTPSPNKFMYYSTILWAKEQGLRYAHLGGGFGAQEDSLFHFKKAFSPLTSTYKTLRCVFLPDVYGDLCRRVGAEQDETNIFFPLYRSVA